MNLFFVNTCAVTLNKTSVLFIGLVKNYKGAINSLEANDSTTAIYNFEFNQWTLQDYLTYKDIKEASNIRNTFFYVPFHVQCLNFISGRNPSSLYSIHTRTFLRNDSR